MRYIIAILIVFFSIVGSVIYKLTDKHPYRVNIHYLNGSSETIDFFSYSYPVVHNGELIVNGNHVRSYVMRIEVYPQSK